MLGTGCAPHDLAPLSASSIHAHLQRTIVLLVPCAFETFIMSPAILQPPIMSAADLVQLPVYACT